MNRIADKIQLVQDGNGQALLELQTQFSPLLKKYAYKLAYDEALDDLTYCFIYLILTIDCSGFWGKDDPFILSYIKKTIHHAAIQLSKRQGKLRRTISFEDLAVQELMEAERRTASQDSYQRLFWDEVRSQTNAHEFEILRLHYCDGYSIAEIAEGLGCSRQAVNQTKNRALQKLRAFYLEP